MTEKNKATICIVQYKTFEMIRLCLRSIRRFTHYPHEVIVVDNGSNDESLDYLKSLKWIRLLQRDSSNDKSGGYSHSHGLNLGLQHCQTEFFVSLHSDVIIHRDDWLADLIDCLNDDPQIACVGSGKIEMTPRWREILKKATDYKTCLRRLFPKPDPTGKQRYYNRTICGIYRTDILKQQKLNFLTGRDIGLTAGHKLYLELLDRGYKTVELPQKTMKQYMMHLAHLTMAANPNEFNLRKRTIRKSNRLRQKILKMPVVRELLADASLDG